MQQKNLIFNVITFLFGMLVTISAFLIHRVCKKRLFTALMALSYLAAMAVGIFPGDTGTIHGLVAMAWFVTAPLSAAHFSGLCRPIIAILSLRQRGRRENACLSHCSLDDGICKQSDGKIEDNSICRAGLLKINSQPNPRTGNHKERLLSKHLLSVLRCR